MRRRNAGRKKSRRESPTNSTRSLLTVSRRLFPVLPRKTSRKRSIRASKNNTRSKRRLSPTASGEIQDIDPGHRGPRWRTNALYEASDVRNGAYPNAKKKADLAYLGLPGVAVPHKKPRKGVLTDKQKAVQSTLFFRSCPCGAWHPAHQSVSHPARRVPFGNGFVFT